MKEKKKLNQNTFLLLVTILLFFVMYAIGCVLFNAQGFAKTQNFLNLFISNAGLIVIGIGMTIVMITGGIESSITQEGFGINQRMLGEEVLKCRD